MAPTEAQHSPNIWVCDECGNDNFDSRQICNRDTCRAARPVRGDILNEGDGTPAAEGNWDCPTCGNNNYANRKVCNMRSCGLPRPGFENVTEVGIQTPILVKLTEVKQTYRPPPGAKLVPMVKLAEIDNAQWECVECGNLNFAGRLACNMRKCGALKPNSNWICPWCGNDNYGIRMACNSRKCGKPRPILAMQEPKDPDNWICPACVNENYQTRDVCNLRSCGMPRPLFGPSAGDTIRLPSQHPSIPNISAPRGGVVVKSGCNWICLSCGNENFSSRTTCNRHSCGLPKPGGSDTTRNSSRVNPIVLSRMVEGVDEPWDCRECGNHNYAGRMQCNRFKCGAPRPGIKNPDHWMCVDCGSENFPDRTSCHKRMCMAPRPGVSHLRNITTTTVPASTASDNWTCRLCQNLNYGSRDVCNMRNCGEPRPWKCVQCGNDNWGERLVCNMRSCGAPKPQFDVQFEGPKRTRQESCGDENWICDECGNENYATRLVCNMRSCNVPRGGKRQKHSP